MTTKTPYIHPKSIFDPGRCVLCDDWATDRCPRCNKQICEAHNEGKGCQIPLRLL